METHSRYPVVLVISMAFVVVCSNVLVNFPVMITIGSVNLGDLLTWGAFTYPMAFLITDLTNRLYGPATARRVVLVGFALAMGCSIVVPQLLFSLGLFPFELTASRLTRIALASGTAFLIAQLLDVLVFDRLRRGNWWKAPVISSTLGSTVDTLLFFTLAFSTTFALLGEGDGYATEKAPLLALFAFEMPRWLSWAMGDYAVKLMMGGLMLIPYGLLRGVMGQRFDRSLTEQG